MTTPSERSLIFGRGPGVDVVVDDAYASPRHCRVVERHGSFWVEDLGSTNGTFVSAPHLGIQQTRIRLGVATRLLPGYKVRIGRTELPWSVR